MAKCWVDGSLEVFDEAIYGDMDLARTWLAAGRSIAYDQKRDEAKKVIGTVTRQPFRGVIVWLCCGK